MGKEKGSIHIGVLPFFVMLYFTQKNDESYEIRTQDDKKRSLLFKQNFFGFLAKNFTNYLRNRKIFTIFASSKGKGWRTALRRLPDEAKRRLPEAETHDRTTT